MHVESAQRLAAQARLAGVKRLVHVSGIGSDAASPSLYIRKRGEGERAVWAAFADAILVRPAVHVRTGRRISHQHPQGDSGGEENASAGTTIETGAYLMLAVTNGRPLQVGSICPLCASQQQAP